MHNRLKPAIYCLALAVCLFTTTVIQVVTTSPAVNEIRSKRQQQNATSSVNSSNQQQQLAATNSKPPRRQQTGGEDEYLVGVGIGDITGPAADINLMGYAKPNQDAGGIHLRQFSRSIVIEDSSGNRLLYISIDNGMISQLLRLRVLERLEQQYGPTMFNESNVMMSATHSHSCPGGFFQYMLYNIPSSGYIQQTLEALVEGIVRSVDRANEQLIPAKIYFNEGELVDASINRSPTSYLNNPAEERSRYQHDTDKGMFLLKIIESGSNKPLAMINWFAVHGTSMNNSNHLISGDNKGYASLLFEQEFNPAGTMPGKGKFVAIFAQANEGDVSPNTMGPRCVDSGLPCDLYSSTCGTPARVQRNNKKQKQEQQQQRREANHQRPSMESYLRHIESMKYQASLNPPVAHHRGKRSVLDWLSSALGLKKKSEKNNRSSSSGVPIPGSLQQAARQQQSNKQDEPNEKCIASGPGKDMFESTKIIAYKQYFKARQLFMDTKSEIRISGPVKFVHEHIDMSKQVVPLYDAVTELAKRQYPNPQIQVNSSYQTCPASLGYSFAAGTTDGPGAFDFQQGDTASSRYWNMVRDFLRRPSDQQIECHKPKPIILSTGEMEFPYQWHPRIVPTQILQLGQLAIVGLPGEFTTMSGRRIRAAVQHALVGTNLDTSESSSGGVSHWGTEQQKKTSVLIQTSHQQATNSSGTSTRRSKRSSEEQQQQQQQQDIKVVLSGLSNIYTSYVTTLEEYEVQRYEGASTLYGPHTLQAYINQFSKLAWHLASGEPLDESNKLEPPDLSSSLFSLKTGVIYDGAPRGHSFGDVLEDANSTYKCGDLVRVEFVAGNPRNDLKQEESFLYVDQLVQSDGANVSATDSNNETSWTVVATDSSWDTKFIWERTNTLMGESKAIIEWHIPPPSATSTCRPGVYRIRHQGAHKSILQKVSQYAGQSSPFKII